MATAAFFDASGGSSGSNSSMLESVELRSRNSKNHATATDPWRHESPNGGNGNSGRVQLIEHKVKNGETIMQIALLYSVPVSEIKRVNNIVTDQEIHAFPIVKVPVSRQFLLRRQLMESNCGGEGQIISLDDEQQQRQSTSSLSNGKGINLHQDSNGTIHPTMLGASSQQRGKNSDKLPLLDYQDQNLHSSAESLLSDNGSGGARTRLAIEGILDEADRTVTAVRQNLPSPGLEGGAFHFVDAGAPDHSSNIWLIVIVVVIMFVLIPLGLTFLEETNEMEEHHQQQLHQQNGLMNEHDG